MTGCTAGDHTFNTSVNNFCNGETLHIQTITVYFWGSELRPHWAMVQAAEKSGIARSTKHILVEPPIASSLTPRKPEGWEPAHFTAVFILHSLVS
jgi:hypothetical protein